jgi:hypothetical protein
LSISAWFLVLLVIDGRLLFGPLKQTVYPTFARAGQEWLDGNELYQHTDGLFRYSPLVAALFAPFSCLPDRWGELAWRLLNAGAYLGALAWWAQTCLPWQLTRSQMATLFLWALPLSVGSLNNGQSNALVLGLLLAALAAVMAERWTFSAALLAAAAYFKIYPLAVGLLLVAVYPRQLGWRLALSLAVGAALPYGLQQPAYVTSQYANWVHYLLADTRIDVALGGACRDLRLLFRRWEIPIGDKPYMAIQLLAAAGVAVICLGFRFAGWPQQRLLTSLLAWACCWMLLLGPATESCTYILLAPSLAWAALDSRRERKPLGAISLRVAAIALFTLALVANWFPFAKTVHTWGVQPLGALCFVGYLAWIDLPRMIKDLIHGFARTEDGNTTRSDNEFASSGSSPSPGLSRRLI